MSVSPLAAGERPTWQPGRRLLSSGALLLALLALWPIGGLLGEGLQGLLNGSAQLGPDGGAQLRGTTLLLLGTALLGGALGTANGWLLANCRFPGRRLLRVARLSLADCSTSSRGGEMGWCCWSVIASFRYRLCSLLRRVTLLSLQLCFCFSSARLSGDHPMITP